ncbi:Thiamin biosynthesis lipoprotein ApbE [Oxalobacteraceae bacterium IMCC9480]|nr:Thiamin biosynthesis lipoprotein ApbE [Oxalobacteraceae bacterium IMCC9480]
MKMSIEKDGIASLQRYSCHGDTMGTHYSAVFFAGAGIDVAAINARLLAAVDQVDRQMSTWKPDSDLSRLNAAPLLQWQAVPRALITVLQAALEIRQQSAGAFDIGVGALVNAWGFGPPQASTPRAVEPGSPVASANSATLEIDHAGLRVRKLAGVTLDLSGIAKGYGVDQLARCMDGLGIADYLVGIDGEMRARGLKPGRQPWAVALERPLPGVRDVMGVMELRDAAIATSGDYRRFVELDGERYAHTMQPLLGAPVRNRLAAVTVVAADCMRADAWATALLVLGEEAGVALAQKRGMDAYFVLREGAGFDEIAIVDGQLQTESSA